MVIEQIYGEVERERELFQPSRKNERRKKRGRKKRGRKRRRKTGRVEGDLPDKLRKGKRVRCYRQGRVEGEPKGSNGQTRLSCRCNPPG